MCACVLSRFSRVRLFVTLWTCSPPGSSVHGILQAGILEWVAISFSKGSSQPRDRTHISCIGKGVLYHWTTWEAQVTLYRLYCSCSQFSLWLYHLKCLVLSLFELCINGIVHSIFCCIWHVCTILYLEDLIMHFCLAVICLFLSLHSISLYKYTKESLFYFW